MPASPFLPGTASNLPGILTRNSAIDISIPSRGYQLSQPPFQVLLDITIESLALRFQKPLQQSFGKALAQRSSLGSTFAHLLLYYPSSDPRLASAGVPTSFLGGQRSQFAIPIGFFKKLGLVPPFVGQKPRDRKTEPNAYYCGHYKSMKGQQKKKICMQG
jgi:hypothetical protein